MNFRKAEDKDINRIMDIIKQAQQYFKENNIDQWQNNYPNKESIKNDIDRGYSYVLEENNKILATFMFSFDGERDYDSIYEGNWRTDGKYAVIHRVAVDSSFKGQGLAGEIFKFAEKICREKNFFSIKMDTHKDNISMQKTLKKNGFKYCGIIYLSYGAERIAFEKIIVH